MKLLTEIEPSFVLRTFMTELANCPSVKPRTGVLKQKLCPFLEDCPTTPFPAWVGARLCQNLLIERANVSAGNVTAHLRCATDRLAYGALGAIRAAGLKPGQDVSVIGYDDLMASEHQTPPLTTMRQSIQSEGAALVKALLGLIEGRPLHELQDLARATMVARQSDGPPPASRPEKTA